MTEPCPPLSSVFAAEGRTNDFSQSMESENGMNRPKKPRGRPRVEQNNGSAADRRRTQIRLAQRAYRMRKESTIASYKEENLHLRKVINDMTDTLAAFQIRALASGLDEARTGLGEDLRTTLARIQQLAREAQEVSIVQHDNNDDDLMEESKRSTQYDSTRQCLTSHENVHSIEVGFEQKHLYCSLDIPEDDSKGLSVVFEPDESIHRDHTLPRLPASPRKAWTQACNSNALHQALLTQNSCSPSHTSLRDWGLVQTSSLSTVTLPVPSTYSFQESSFSRRLHRACLEHAIHLLANPGTQPDDIVRKFSHPLQHISLPELRSRISMRLSRPVAEPLDNHERYPVRSQTQNYHYMPFEDVYCQLPSSPAKTQSLEEAWLSVDQVEEYVSAKGLHLGSQSVFAEGELLHVMPAPDLKPQEFDLQSWRNQIFLHENSVVLHDTYGWQSQYSQDPSTLSQKDFSWSKTRIILDVARFIGVLVEYAVCQGHTPGVRVSEVEYALRSSAFTAQ